MNANNNDLELLNNDKNLASQSYGSELSSQEKLALSSWSLPDSVLQYYKNKGISRMFPWQLDCLMVGKVLEGGNLVYSAPTSAGKTLVAEILISQTVLERQKKALVILPFVSVAREKMFYFQDMFSSSGIRVEGYMGGHTPSLGFQKVHIGVCTIEKANSLVNRFLEEKNLQKLGLIVVDELHLLGDSYRGYLLELLLTKLKYMCSVSEDINIQIVGMSATLPNLKILATWLNADLFYTDFRPVPLAEKLKCEKNIFDKKCNKIDEIVPFESEIEDDPENVGQMCIETIGNGHSVLIFCPTKVWCENLTDKIATFFRKHGCSKSAEVENTPGWILRKELNLPKINEVIEHLKMSPVGLDKDLCRGVAYGVAFHHAGLTLDERDIIEGSFRQGSIRVLCATSTLSSGVNLPARRVIIRSPMSFGGLMDILTYRQMIGRAGRMGVDTQGESILICKPTEKVMCHQLMSSNLKPIESCLGHGRLSASLKRAVLEIVASGVASTPEQVKSYADCTFLACSSKYDIQDPIQSCIQFLEENEFIRLHQDGNVYVATPLGQACLASSLPPDEGLSLFRELQRARRCFVLDTDLHIIYQVTPYSVSEQWVKLDWMNVLNILEELPPSMKRVGELVGIEESFLVRVAKGMVNPNLPENRKKLSIHRRFYTSLALQDLVNEVPLTEVAQKYECNKGTLQSLQQSAATYAGMVTEFTRRLGWASIELIVKQFQERLQFGVQRELCELMRLSLLNGLRARALYNAGFTNLSSLARADVTELENALHKATPFQSKKEIAGETSYDREQRNKLQNIWVTGKAGLSVRQAAEMLISEARKALQLELGLESVKWANEEDSLSDSQNSTQLSYPAAAKIGLRDKSKCNTSMTDNSKPVKVNTPVIKTSQVSNSTATLLPQDIPLKSFSEPNKEDKTNYVIEEMILMPSQLNKTGNSSNVKFSEEQMNGFKTDIPGNESNKTNSINFCPVKENTKAETTQSVTAGARSSIIVKDNSVHPSQVDYFASSFNIDGIPEDIQEIGAPENIEDCGRTINESSSSHDSDSDSSVEVVYHRTINFSLDNSNTGRFSDDMFDMDHQFSTPAPVSTFASRKAKNFKDPTESMSPDLFSQSLTFDTQLQRVLDFEEFAELEKENAEKEIHLLSKSPSEKQPDQVAENRPSTSFNSDDLGFVSDLSPPRLLRNNQQVNENKEKPESKVVEEISESFFQNAFESQFDIATKKTEGTKRKSCEDCCSPDFIFDSNEDLVKEQISKRPKINITKTKANLVQPSEVVTLEESDDEFILATPKLDRTSLSKLSKSNRTHNRSLRQLAQKNLRTIAASGQPKNVKMNSGEKSISKEEKNASNFAEKNFCETANKLDHSKEDKIFSLGLKNWDKINMVDVCGKKEVFRSFCQDLKERNIMGLAVGCRLLEEKKKSFIGSKIRKRKSDEPKTCSNICQHGETILDGIAFYLDGNNVFYVTMNDSEINLSEKIALLKSIEGKVLRMFDAREQIKIIQRCTTVLLDASYQDPKTASWLLSKTEKEQNLSSMVLEHFSEAVKLTELLGPLIGVSSPGLLLKTSVPPKIRACVESLLSFHLIARQLDLLRKADLHKVFQETEMPIAFSLVDMELTGFKFDRTKLLEIKNKLETSMLALEKKAFSLANHTFSLNSPAAVCKVLYNELGLGGPTALLKSGKKKPSTNKKALEDLAIESKHPLPEIILQWRKIHAVVSKVICPLLHIPVTTSRVFGVSQTLTSTGRISMQEPNLQNIPRDFEINLNDDVRSWVSLRDVFVASDQNVLLAADYCQIELRLLAHLSQDEGLLYSISNVADLFVDIASTIYDIPHPAVTDDLRQKAKQTCYGIIYGIGPRALSHELRIDENDALALMEEFRNKYDGVRRYVEQTIEDCRKKGYVETFFGRRRYLPSINHSNPAIRSEAERQAVNTTIQGSAADLAKVAMVQIRQDFKKFLIGAETHLVLHLHDELIYEVHRDHVLNAAALLKNAMENAVVLDVPIPVKVRSGSSWGQLKLLEV